MDGLLTNLGRARTGLVILPARAPVPLRVSRCINGSFKNYGKEAQAGGMSDRQVGIPTDYSHLTFRSRLEATWAVMFDLLEWPWDYEPFDCAGWIPDFLLKGKFPVLIDVKPVSSVAECRQHGPKIENAQAPYPVAIIGCGLLTGRSWQGQFGELVFSLKDNSPFSMGSDLSLGRCPVCEKLTWFTEQMSWDCGLCGEYGHHWMNPGEPESVFTPLWHRAKDLVRWEPKR